MSETFTHLPTEPGLYLFVGERDPDRFSREKPSAELVRVFWNGGTPGTYLMYVGRDFFYKPYQAIDVWRRVGVGDMEAQGQRLLDLYFLGKAIEELKTASYHRNTLKGLEDMLSSSGGKFRVRDEDQRAGLLALAREEGLLPE